MPNQSQYRPQPTQPQSTQRRFQRSGRPDAALLSPSSGILTPEDRPAFHGRQGGLDNSRAPHRLDISNSMISSPLSMPEPSIHAIHDAHSMMRSYSDPFQGRNEAVNNREAFYNPTNLPNANTSLHRIHAQQQADGFNSNLSTTQALAASEIRRHTDRVSHPASSTLQLRNNEVHDREGFHSRQDSRTRGSHESDRLDVVHSEYRPERPPLEQNQRSRNHMSNNRTESSNQYHQPLATSGSSWTATQGAGPSSNSFPKVLPPRGIHQDVKPAMNNYGASRDRFEKSKTTRMKTSEIHNQELYDSGNTQIHDRNASRSQVFHPVVPPESVASPDSMQSNAFFQNAHSVNISGNPNFQNNVTNVYGREIDGLKNLDGFISFDAQFDSSAQDPTRQCHRGTRQNVLKRMRDWIDNPNSTERIFWLYGPAGAGKSAIAQTIAHSYAQSTVAATFFFFRSDPNLNDGNRLFTTLAYQLARSIPGIRDHIARSLYERPDLPRADVVTQFRQLIALPFRALNKDVTQQKLAPVIIIDGVDECTDENLQQRFLKVISDAVKDKEFPLRFLICSRPELHIEQTIRRFQNQTPVRTIDLANLDDANRDIEEYLVDEFSRIASNQGLDPAWPGQNIIDDIVYKSSGNFIFASIVIKFVGDPYCYAKTQLDIVLDMKPPKKSSPFQVLDQLFWEILRRVQDQDFLKRYLDILTARISVSGSYGDLYKDDAVLMHVTEEELHANLGRMRSLLRFEARIDVHHRSFLDFLHDSSRSREFCVGIPGGIRRYLWLFVDSLVRYVDISMRQSDRHNDPHFRPNFRAMIKNFPPMIELPLNEWSEVIRPLLDLQDKILQLPNSATIKIQRCDECTVFNLLRELLHLGLHLGYKGQTNNTSAQSVMNVRMRQGIFSATTKPEKRNSKDLDSIFLSLFARLPARMVESWLPDEMVIKLMSIILQFNATATEMAQSVRFVSDAQKLVDLLVYLIDEKNILSRIRPNATRKATLLALEIFARVPILPLTSFLHGNSRVHSDPERYLDFPIQILSQTIIASRVLDRRYIVPMWVVDVGKEGFMLVNADADGNDLSMKQWRQKTKIPNSVV